MIPQTSGSSDDLAQNKSLPARLPVFNRADGRYLGSIRSGQVDAVLAAEPRSLCFQVRRGRSPRWALYIEDEDTLLLIDRQFPPHALIGSHFVELEHLQGREWVGLDGVEHKFVGGYRCWRHSIRAVQLIHLGEMAVRKRRKS